MQNEIIKNKNKFIQQYNLTDNQFKQLYFELIDEDLKLKIKLTV